MNNHLCHWSALTILGVTGIAILNAAPVIAETQDFEVLPPTIEISSENADVLTDVQVQATESGLVITFETTAEALPAVTTTTVGDRLIIEIPDVILSLPGENIVEVLQPTAEIESVQISPGENGGGRIVITGLTAPPMAAPQLTGEQLIVEVTPDESTAENLELVVTADATANSYTVSEATTATRTDTPLAEIPQSIQVIPKAILADQGVSSLDDALRNTSGVLQNSADARGQRFVVRGFDSASVLRDGFRPTFGFSGNIGYPELANIEQVEVLKGPAAILYGVSEPGGVINLVSEKPLSEPFYEATLELGNRNQVAVGVDLSGPLNEDGNLLYRLNALYRNSDYYRNFNVDLERTFIAPTLTWQIGDRTDLDLFVEYSADQRPYDTGLVAIGDSVADIPFDRNLSQLDDINEATYWRTGYEFEHRFSDNWKVRNGFNYIAYNTIFESSFTLGFDPTTGDLDRSYIQLDQPSSTYAVQTNVVGEFSTGAVDHTVLMGVDYIHRNQSGNNLRGFGPNSSFTQNIFNPIYGTVPRPDFETQPIIRFGDTYINAVGIYLQDQMDIGDRLHLLAGLRYDTVSQRVVNPTSLAETTQNDDAFVPRLGVVYRPIEPISLYTSYSQSFAPNSGTNVDGDTLPPEAGEQFEVGVRAEALEGALVTNLAYFDIRKNNVATSDPDNIGFSINAGQQRSQGIELDVMGEILPGWKIVANYAYTDARVTANNDGQAGNRLINSPYHSANLWTTYELQTGSLKGLSFGVGVNYVGDRFGDLNNSFSLGDYFLTNAAIAYRQDNWRAALNFRNLFDVEHITGTRNNRFEVYPGEGFTLLGTLAVEF
ncbi:TonB-dependent receptor (plasmid) [Picosynechococcus sp. PCC 11901]|uniref:TonB-dependent receptor n=1 Tax=Picosynechococcus sp. PCC 11901 TaxID=2579791 RepID=UPI0010FBD2E7|nr:TonB-dependent receptor [Picosynechococcus sp. PCC 11901]QCS51087.1 TonB-dependent receptor [Picosynechococcus sp. PCC 11901]